MDSGGRGSVFSALGFLQDPIEGSISGDRSPTPLGLLLDARDASVPVAYLIQRALRQRSGGGTVSVGGQPESGGLDLHDVCREKLGGLRAEGSSSSLRNDAA